MMLARGPDSYGRGWDAPPILGAHARGPRAIAKQCAWMLPLLADSVFGVREWTHWHLAECDPEAAPVQSVSRVLLPNRDSQSKGQC